jgi:hypothetical protein
MPAQQAPGLPIFLSFQQLAIEHAPHLAPHWVALAARRGCLVGVLARMLPHQVIPALDFGC